MVTLTSNDLVDVSDMKAFIGQEVARRSDLQRSGQLGSRRQATDRTEEEISTDGIVAEAIFIRMMCPDYRPTWEADLRSDTPNRGRDIAATALGLQKPIEIKQSSCPISGNQPNLIIRPPRYTPGCMCDEYIDDSIYVLIWSEGYTGKILGCANRFMVLRHKRVWPARPERKQRECYAVSHSKLLPISQIYTL